MVKQCEGGLCLHKVKSKTISKEEAQRQLEKIDAQIEAYRYKVRELESMEKGLGNYLLFKLEDKFSMMNLDEKALKVTGKKRARGLSKEEIEGLSEGFLKVAANESEKNQVLDWKMKRLMENGYGE